MKKLLLIAALLVALMLAAVACDGNGDPAETDPTPTTTVATTEADTPAATEAATETDAVTEADTPAATEPATEPETEPATEPKTEPATEPVTEPATEPETEPVTEEPKIYVTPAEAGMKNSSYDTFYIGETIIKDGQAGDYLNSIDNTIVFAEDDVITTIGFRGWIGFEAAIATYGYMIDDGEPVWNDSFRQDAEQGVLDAGGANATRFTVTVDVSVLKGTHTVTFLVKLADDTIVLLHQPVTVKTPTGIPENLSNVALNQTVVASENNEHPGNTFFNPTFVNDGIYTTYNGADMNTLGWLNNTSVGYNSVRECDITVDLHLDKTYTIYQIVLKPMMWSEGRNFPADYSVQLSMDGETWTTIATETDVNAEAETNLDVQPFIYDVEGGMDAKFFRVHITKNSTEMDATSYISAIGEIELMGVAQE